MESSEALRQSVAHLKVGDMPFDAEIEPEETRTSTLNIEDESLVFMDTFHRPYRL